MVVMKMTHMVNLPEVCDDCIYYGCKPHPYKGWSDICELCGQCMDDGETEGLIYDGNGKPKNCPLIEVEPQPKMGRWEKHDVRGQRVDCCSVCGLSNGTIYEYNYCPNCGAKMQEVEND